MTYTVSLPWPNAKLSPNARTHWRAKAPLTKAHRATAAALTREALGRETLTSVSLMVTFCPPDKRRRDALNCIASFKSYEDGIADAVGIDDSKFQSTYAIGAATPGGAVVVVIGGAE
jgi:crossover junction endodeoxyribonuclease RusA